MLPPTLHKLSPVEIKAITDKVREPFLASVDQLRIGSGLEQVLVDLYIPLAATLTRKAQNRDSPLLVGINGAQGSGKSTLCQLLQIVLKEGFSKQVATLSIDDIYLTLAERQTLAKEIHPLLVTRGVPGTHDVNLGLQLISAFRELRQGQQIDVPVFDKAIDDRLPRKKWQQVSGPLDLVLFEGWCVGAQAQTEEELAEPVNSLESDEDPDQSWRHYVNRQLQQEYNKLFNELDFLVMLKIPGMSSVMEWRGKQEHKLAQTTSHGDQKIMDAKALQRFIMHYERLTRSMLTEMSDRADLVFEINANHQINDVQINTPF